MPAVPHPRSSHHRRLPAERLRTGLKRSTERPVPGPVGGGGYSGGKAKSWKEPGFDNWIEAGAAWFVVDSKQTGGMGAPETIPFGTEEGAKEFAASNGGRVLRLDDIPVDYVLAPVELSSAEQLTPGPAAEAEQ